MIRRAGVSLKNRLFSNHQVRTNHRFRRPISFRRFWRSSANMYSFSSRKSRRTVRPKSPRFRSSRIVPKILGSDCSVGIITPHSVIPCASRLGQENGTENSHFVVRDILPTVSNKSQMAQISMRGLPRDSLRRASSCDPLRHPFEYQDMKRIYTVPVQQAPHSAGIESGSLREH